MSDSKRYKLTPRTVTQDEWSIMKDKFNPQATEEAMTDIIPLSLIYRSTSIAPLDLSTLASQTSYSESPFKGHSVRRSFHFDLNSVGSDTAPITLNDGYTTFEGYKDRLRFRLTPKDQGWTGTAWEKYSFVEVSRFLPARADFASAAANTASIDVLCHLHPNGTSSGQQPMVTRLQPSHSKPQQTELEGRPGASGTIAQRSKDHQHHAELSDEEKVRVATELEQRLHHHGGSIKCTEAAALEDDQPTLNLSFWPSIAPDSATKVRSLSRRKTPPSELSIVEWEFMKQSIGHRVDKDCLEETTLQIYHPFVKLVVSDLYPESASFLHRCGDREVSQASRWRGSHTRSWQVLLPASPQPAKVQLNDANSIIETERAGGRSYVYFTQINDRWAGTAQAGYRSIEVDLPVQGGVTHQLDATEGVITFAFPCETLPTEGGSPSIGEVLPGSSDIHSTHSAGFAFSSSVEDSHIMPVERISTADIDAFMKDCW